jgi:hypothetical protein
MLHDSRFALLCDPDYRLRNSRVAARIPPVRAATVYSISLSQRRMRSQSRTVASARDWFLQLASLQVLSHTRCTCVIAAQPETCQRKAREAHHRSPLRRDTIKITSSPSQAMLPLWPTLLITPVAKPITREESARSSSLWAPCALSYL